jgi:mRNA interferase RelE/StbE
MAWTVTYHPNVEHDLLSLGRAEARAILKVIEERIAQGEPDKLGKPLAGALSGCRRIRTGQTRIVYRVDGGRIEVLIIAVGMRRDNEIYDTHPAGSINRPQPGYRRAGAFPDSGLTSQRHRTWAGRLSQFHRMLARCVEGQLGPALFGQAQVHARSG